MTGWLIACGVTVGGLVLFLATVLGLPGIWGMVGIGALLAWLADGDSFYHVAWIPVLVMAGVALLGELIEFAASAAGVGQMGGARRSAWLALAGSMIGAIAGLFVGLPVPVVGSLISSVLLGGAGAAAGAVIGERWKGRQWDASVRVGAAAAVGRLLGTVGKSACAAVVLVLLVWQVWTS